MDGTGVSKPLRAPCMERPLMPSTEAGSGCGGERCGGGWPCRFLVTAATVAPIQSSCSNCKTWCRDKPGNDRKSKTHVVPAFAGPSNRD